MARDGTDVAKLAPEVLDALPYVGRLVGTLARAALSESETKGIQRCLEGALRVDGHGHTGSWKDHLPVIGAARTMKALRRQAAEDFMADAVFIEPGRPVPSGPTPATPAAQAPAVPEAPQELAVFLPSVARKELSAALAEGVFVPWTDRLAGALTVLAERRWTELKKRNQYPEEEREKWATVILNDLDAKPREVDDAALVAFGHRIGLRFEVNLSREKHLCYLVERLDHYDHQRAELAMLAAAQGLRLALTVVAVAIAVLLAVALGVEIDQLGALSAGVEQLV
jgi:hypothetical protein